MENHVSNLIGTDLKVFRWNEERTSPFGDPYPVYYDVKANVYVILDFPDESGFFEMSHVPELGFAEITDFDGITHQVRFSKK